jgi:DNA-binding transcriptional MocR family regulator
VHSLIDDAPELASIDKAAKELGTLDGVIQFSSTSKITFAGAGLGFMSSSQKNIKGFTKQFSAASIGSDKINQLRHVNFIKDLNNLKDHMRKHAALIKPKFDAADQILSEHFSDNDMGDWYTPQGGYFISFNTRPGLAKEVVRLAAEVGVKLTPAGATFPYGQDPENKNIRIAPTFPAQAEVEQAVKVFANCVKLASLRQESRV